MKIFFFAFILLFLISCSSVTRIYLVRHAEKAGPSGNVDLKNPEGFERANALRDSLASVNLSGVFSTNFLRTLHTAGPTAGGHDRQVILYTDGDKLVDSLSQLRNKKFLVVGHSNTVPAMVRHLGLDAGFSGDIPDNDFDNLFIVTVRRKRSTITKAVERKTYGAPSP